MQDIAICNSSPWCSEFRTFLERMEEYCAENNTLIPAIHFLREGIEVYFSDEQSLNDFLTANAAIKDKALYDNVQYVRLLFSLRR